MFKPSRINYSALSKRTKRVQVQLQRDFPRFNLYKGQVAQVKPTVMMNYLHPFNGAQYIMKPDDINGPLLKQYELRQEKLKAQTETVAQNKEKKKPDKELEEVKQEEAKKKKITFLGTDITTKDIKIPGLNV